MSAQPTAGGERAAPYHCPFCAEDDLRPHGPTHGAWHCRSCLRVFAVRFLGVEGLPAAPSTGSATSGSLGTAAPTTGDPR